MIANTFARRIVALIGIMMMASAGFAAPNAAAVQDALKLINQQRSAAGCGPLKLQPQLTAAAQAHSKAMATQNFISHRGKDGAGAGQRMRAYGYDWHRMGENIAGGQPTARTVVAAWMKSAGHRRNILDCNFVETGIALTYQENDTPIGRNQFPTYFYWVQVFGTR